MRWYKKCVCGADKDLCIDCMNDWIEKAEKLLRHCKMFIVENRGYNEKREDEIKLFINEFGELDI